jgi:hypothetical protein
LIVVLVRGDLVDATAAMVKGDRVAAEGVLASDEWECGKIRYRGLLLEATTIEKLA